MANLAKLKRKMKQAVNKPKDSWQIIMMSAFKALVYTIIVLMLLSFLITYSSLPENIVPISTIALSIVMVLFAGKKSSKNIGKKGWLVGGLTALAYIVFMSVIGTLFTPNSPFTHMLSYWPILVSGVIGGIWGV